MEKAFLLFKQMNYRGALKIAQRALKSSESEPEDLVSAYRIQGLCLAAMGKEGKAVQSFKRLLAIDPSFRLSRDISPKLMPPFKKAVRVVADLDPISLVHQEPDLPDSLAGLALKVTIQSDPFKMIETIRLQYQAGGIWRQVTASDVKAPGSVTMVLPDDLEEGEIVYYFEAQNRFGGILARAGNEGEPFRVETLSKARVAVEAPPLLPDPGLAATDPTGSPPSKTDEEENGATAWYKSWWFWTIVGAVVAGAATTTVLMVGGTTSGDDYYYYDIQIE
jgi:tetratricopeptide (TPR) repeat protein